MRLFQTPVGFLLWDILVLAEGLSGLSLIFVPELRTFFPLIMCFRPAAVRSLLKLNWLLLSRMSLWSLCIWSVIKQDQQKLLKVLQKEKWSIVEKGGRDRKTKILFLHQTWIDSGSLHGLKAVICVLPLWWSLNWSQTAAQSRVGTVLDGCISLYWLAAGALLFPCRWPVRCFVAALTSSCFLPLNGQRGHLVL